MKITLLLQRTYEQLQNDSRVLRTAQELKSCGHDVNIVIDSSQVKQNNFEIKGVEINYAKTVFKLIPDCINPRLPKRVNFILLSSIRHFLKPFVNMLMTYRIVKLLSTNKADVYWANDFETLQSAIALKKRTGCLIVYDSHEYWSGRIGLRSQWYTFYRIFLRLKEVYNIDKYVAVIVSVNQEIVDMLKRGNKPSFCLYNIPSTQDISPINKYFHKHYNLDEDKKVLIYQGGLQEGRGIRFIISSIRAFPFEWVVVFMGYGALESFIEAQALATLKGRVFLHPAVPSSELLNYTAAADVGLCTIESLSISYKYALPNKFWEYLQAGVPIVSTRLPSMSSIQVAHHLGEEFDERNQEGFIRAIQSVLEKHAFYNEQTKKAQKVFDYESNVVHTYKKISDTLINLLNDH